MFFKLYKTYLYKKREDQLALSHRAYFLLNSCISLIISFTS